MAVCFRVVRYKYMCPAAPSQFARVAKGVDLRSTAGNCARVRTPQLTRAPPHAPPPPATRAYRMYASHGGTYTITRLSPVRLQLGAGREGTLRLAAHRALRGGLTATHPVVRIQASPSTQHSHPPTHTASTHTPRSLRAVSHCGGPVLSAVPANTRAHRAQARGCVGGGGIKSALGHCRKRPLLCWLACVRPPACQCAW